MSKVLFIDSVHEILEQRLTAMQYTCEHDYQSDRTALSHKLGEYEGIVIRSRITLDEEMLDAATSLK